MTIAFASSMLDSEKDLEPNFPFTLNDRDLTSFLAKGKNFAFQEKENSSFQRSEALIFTSDTFMAGQHFSPQERPQDIARCMLRTSLSHMVACGTNIKGYLMALSLPQDLDPSWLESFKATLVEEEEYFQLSSLGGDVGMTSGPLTVTFTMVGVRLTRPKTQAHLGDRIYVTGFLGDRAMGRFLSQPSGHEICAQLSESTTQYLRTRYLQPDPYISLVPRLLPYISTCLSLSEGLVKDLTHLCRNAGLHAYIDLKALPRSEALQEVSQQMNLDLLTYGFTEKDNFREREDRELLFTAPVDESDQISYLAHAFNLAITPIGYMGIRQSPQERDYVHWIAPKDRPKA